MSYGPNADAAAWLVQSILPIVRRERPSVRLAIVGRSPAPAVTALSGEGVLVTGDVQDVRPWLERASMLVAPLRIGGGTRLKIVEALAMGCPVVTTAVGADGLDLRSGEHLCLAEGPEALAGAILDLLENRERGAAESIALEGRTTIRADQTDRKAVQEGRTVTARMLSAWSGSVRLELRFRP